MAKYAFKVFYEGQSYRGYQRQPNGLAIENFLEMAFIKAGYIKNFDQVQYLNSSRTDAGVSAIENIFTLKLNHEPNLAEINMYLPKNIIVWAVTQVSEEFHPRKKVQKEYQYYLPKTCEFYNLERLKHFEGKHDFSAFIRANGAGSEDPYCEIFSIKIKENESNYKLGIIADKFGREQIRRMIGYLTEEEYKGILPKQIINKEIYFEPTSAEPEYLILRSIKFDEKLEWEIAPHIKYLVEENITKIEESNINIKEIIRDLLMNEI